MIEKIEQQLQSENLKLGQQSKPILKIGKESRSTHKNLYLLLSLSKTVVFLVLLLVVGVFSIPFAILASQVDKQNKDDGRS